MAIVSIIVNWKASGKLYPEVITLDLAELKQKPAQWHTIQTVQTARGVKPEHWVYKTDCMFDHDKDGGGRLTIRYLKRENPHLVDLNGYWGSSVFELNEKMDEGEVKFFNHADDADQNSDPHPHKTSWKKFSSDDANVKLDERELEEISRRARKQAVFRSRLMMIDPKCAITGESEPSVLEAAHVVPVADDGDEIDGNGLMLRADLHRLFDSKLFDITEGGRITISEDLKSEDRSLLREEVINPLTFARISKALKVRAASKHR